LHATVRAPRAFSRYIHARSAKDEQNEGLGGRVNDVARLFLETYARGGEPDGGWKFGKALQQARLDFSHESLERVDLLLKAIRERAKPVHDKFLADPAGRNFCALLA
jgi:hypothetical protein